MHRKLGRTVAAAVITMIASAAFASTADAALLTASADSCDDGPITQPFQRFGDSANYKLLSGGSFEAGTDAWQLSGGAKLVSGNESYNVGGAGSRSLSLPQGSAAVSPFTCVGLAEPSLRLFAKRTAPCSAWCRRSTSRSRSRPASASRSGSRCCRATLAAARGTPPRRCR